MELSRKDTRSIKRQIKDWDNISPNREYFLELFRVSKNQIIFGANNKNAKFTNGQIIEIRKSKNTITEIAKQYNVAMATIRRIKSNHIYKDII